MLSANIDRSSRMRVVHPQHSILGFRQLRSQPCPFATSKPSPERASFIAGLTSTSPATSSRWVTVDDGKQRHVEVCWKHEEGEIAESDLEPVPAG